MGGRDLAMHRVVPADQSLDAALRLGGEIVLRLVDDLELLAAQRQPELMLDHAPALQGLVHARLEEAHALAAVALGLGERDVGMAQHLGGGVAVAGGERDADARRAYHVLVGDAEGTAQGLDQSVHVGHDITEIGDVDQRDGELIGAAACHEIALAQRALNADADLAQHRIAAGMVRRVVDLLELVDVETEHGDMGAVPMHGDQRVGQTLAERVAVGETGEGVVIFQIVHLRLRLAALSAAHPGKADRRGDASDEQQQGDGGDQAEIVGEHARLFALVEIDDKRPTQLAGKRKRKLDDSIMPGRGSAGRFVQTDLGRVEHGAFRGIGKLAAEIQSGVAAGEGEAAELVVKLVAKHAGAISGMLEDAAKLRCKRALVQGIEQRAGLLHQLGVQAVGRNERLALELHHADPARGDKNSRGNQCAEQE